jgi:hypothetical protein
MMRRITAYARHCALGTKRVEKESHVQAEIIKKREMEGLASSF